MRSHQAPVQDEPPAPQSRPEAAAWVRALSGWPGVSLALAWGAAEATLFFLVPDMVITLAALLSPRRSLWHLGAVVAGALVGGAILFGWATADPAKATAAVRHVPFVSARMFDTVIKSYEVHGVAAPCYGVMSGIPYKVYAVTAPGRVALLPFLLVSIAARLERLVFSWACFATTGWLLARKIAVHPRIALLCHALCWIAIYAFYWSRI